MSRNTVRRYLRGEGRRATHVSATEQTRSVQEVPSRTGEGRGAGMDSGEGAAAGTESARLSGRHHILKGHCDAEAGGQSPCH